MCFVTPSPRTAREPRTAFAILWRFSLVLLLAILALRLIWGWYIDRQLNAYITDLRDRGEPVHASDIKYARVPDSDDAWPLIVNATKSNTFDSPRSGNVAYSNYPPYSPTWIKLAAESNVKNAPALALMDEASTKTGANPPDHFQMIFKTFTPCRHLANTLADAAQYEQSQGRDVVALKRLEQMFLLSDSMRQDDLLISQLVATGIDALAYNVAKIVAPGLRPDAPQPATRAQVQHLAARLLKEDELWERMRRSFPRERAFAFDNAKQAFGDTWITCPQAKRELLAYVRVCDVGSAVSEPRNAPEIVMRVKRAIPSIELDSRLEFPAAANTSQPTLTYFQGFDNPMFVRFLNTQIRALADRRTTAISLAIQLFRMDHNRWPARLDELVPAYLPHLPADPYHDDGRPIGYVMRKLPDGSDRPMLYFDAGDDAAPPDEPTYGWHQASAPKVVPRQYRDVSRFAPPPQPEPSTQPGEDDPDESDGPGQ
jgi:hypothetical protein